MLELLAMSGFYLSFSGLTKRCAVVVFAGVQLFLLCLIDMVILQNMSPNMEKMPEPCAF
ncbi:hypothetical protein [Vibrio rotiferianus]|uniref:hypothetical protein n=1 Tax=Vibrio rotiferianus TaxID=190895 RepID=UPI001586F938|nr:hypothetical protein [Vibrio rotiferianus]